MTTCMLNNSSVEPTADKWSVVDHMIWGMYIYKPYQLVPSQFDSQYCKHYLFSIPTTTALQVVILLLVLASLFLPQEGDCSPKPKNSSLTTWRMHCRMAFCSRRTSLASNWGVRSKHTSKYTEERCKYASLSNLFQQRWLSTSYFRVAILQWDKFLS